MDIFKFYNKYGKKLVFKDLGYLWYSLYHTEHDLLPSAVLFIIAIIFAIMVI